MEMINEEQEQTRTNVFCNEMRASGVNRHTWTVAMTRVSFAYLFSCRSFDNNNKLKHSTHTQELYSQPERITRRVAGRVRGGGGDIRDRWRSKVRYTK